MEKQTIVAAALDKILHKLFCTPGAKPFTTAQFVLVAAIEAHQITPEQANRLSDEFHLNLHW